MKVLNVEKPEDEVSPKVSWGGLAGLIAACFAAVISALIVDPQGLGFALPTWAVFLIITSGPVIVQALVAYAKADPLRTREPLKNGAPVLEEEIIHGGDIVINKEDTDGPYSV